MKEEEIKEEEQKQIPTALLSLIMICKIHNIIADYEKIKHNYAVDNDLDDMTLIRVSKDLGLKTRKISSSYEKLSKMALPAIIKLKDNEYAILAKLQQDKALIFRHRDRKTVLIEKEELIKLWVGDIILLTPRGIKKYEREFGIKWFIPTILKYKQCLIEVLLATLVLQILGLGTFKKIASQLCERFLLIY